MKKQIDHVAKFHDVFQIGNELEPVAVVGEGTYNLRYNLMKEENDEYLDACKDGDLVEMRFNPEASNSCYWEPLRIRSDKTDPQFFIIANRVWDTIQNPITTEMIQGDYDIEEMIEENEEGKGRYYVNDSESKLLESNI